MRPIENIRDDIAAVEAAIKPLDIELSELKRELSKAESLAWIRANNIKRGDVQMSSGKGIPFFGDVWTFGKWISSNSTKLWCEWNGRIYNAAEISAGRMARHAPGCVEHLP